MFLLVGGLEPLHIIQLTLDQTLNILQEERDLQYLRTRLLEEVHEQMSTVIQHLEQVQQLELIRLMHLEQIQEQEVILQQQ